MNNFLYFHKHYQTSMIEIIDSQQNIKSNTCDNTGYNFGL